MVGMKVAQPQRFLDVSRIQERYLNAVTNQVARDERVFQEKS